eukprot:Em0019g240a
MELLYRSTIPEGSIHCMAWSGVNLIALGVSVEREGFVGENFERAKSHQLLVLDPNRPWDYQSIVLDNKHRTSCLSWSQDGSKLIAIDTEGVLHIWRMKNQSANVWVCQHKQEWAGGGSLVYAGWLECHTAVDVTSSQEQNKMVDVQMCSPHLRILLGGEAFVVIGNNGKVSLILFIPTLTRTIEASLDVSSSTIVAASVVMLPSGVVLCAVACADCNIKIFTFNMTLCLGSQLSLHPTLVAQFNPTGSQRGDECISGFQLSPQIDGCSVHVICNGNSVQEWSVRDVTRTGMYQSKMEHTYSSPGPICSIAASTLCQRTCATPTIGDLMRPCVTTPTVTDILMLGVGEETYPSSEARWPPEVIAFGLEGGSVVLLNRDTYRVMATHQLRGAEESSTLSQPAAKRCKMQEAGPVVCLSPNACCLIASHKNTLQLFCNGELLSGLNDVSHCCSLLRISASTRRSPWDIAVLCSRNAARDHDSGKVRKVLTQLGAEYVQRSATSDQTFYFSTCVLLHSCLEDGLQASLMYRNMARFHGTVNLLKLALPAYEDEELTDALAAVCSDNPSEESLEAVAATLKHKTLSIPPGTASQLQSHIHWVLEFTIDIISTIVKGDIIGAPDLDTLLELRMTLVLVYVMNKTLPVPLIPVPDTILLLFFRVVTVCLKQPSSPLPDELQSEVISNIPCNKYPSLLTLTRAAFIQGFLSGLATTCLPESYTRGMAPPIRPHVQKNYMSTDPYSPLMLVVPKGLSPPWRDCFTDGQRDMIHGGTILKDVVQNAKLKQCSRCRCWTVASESLRTSELTDARSCANPIQQWRNAWSTNCFCGGLWNIRSTNGM